MPTRTIKRKPALSRKNIINNLRVRASRDQRPLQVGVTTDRVYGEGYRQALRDVASWLETGTWSTHP